jgi:GAF domain-containing protein
MLAIRLRRLISFDTVAIYSCDGERLNAEYAHGAESQLFSSLHIPVGAGVSGWVAANCKPIVNGNPAVETCYLEDSTKLSSSQSTLAVPLLSAGRLLGVISLYRAAADAFNGHDLTFMLNMSHEVAMIVESATNFDSGSQDAKRQDLDGNTESLVPHLTVH